MFKHSFWMLAPALLLAACGQSSSPAADAASSENVPWSYEAPADKLTTLALDPGPNTLSFEPLLSATNGYGPVELNKSNGEAAAGDGKPLTLNGVVYQKGFGVHSDSSLVYSLQNTKGAVCSIFTASVGVDDEVGTKGSVRFQVLTGATPATATQVYDSGVMTGSSATKSLNLNVAGAKVLILRVTDAGDGKNFDHADWVNPNVTCASAASPAPGTVDTGFDSSGFGKDASGNPLVSSFTTLQPDGKIIGFGVFGGNNFFVKRVDQDGHPDSSFGTPGTPFSGPPFIAGTALGLTTSPDGSILVMGEGFLPRAIPGFGSPFKFLQRLLPNGVVDSGFGNGAAFGYPGIQFLNEGNTAALQPDGKILVGGNTADGFFVRRFLVNGQDDASFGTAGRVTTSLTSQNIDTPVVKTMAVQPDGKILMAGGGHASDNFGAYINSGWQIIIRYNANGTLDTSFDSDGIVKQNIARYGAVAQTINTLQSGKIIIAGNTVNTPGASCTVNRLNADGTNDSTFQFTASNIGTSAQTTSLALQSDGRLILGGCVFGLTQSSRTPALFRFNTDGTQDNTFGQPLVPGVDAAGTGAPIPDSANVLIQPANVGGKIISGLNTLTRVWP